MKNLTQFTFINVINRLFIVNIGFYRQQTYIRIAMKIAKIIFQIFKVVVVILSIGYIFLKLYNESQNGVLFKPYHGLCLNSFFYLMAVVLLVPVNWIIESIKFIQLLKPIQIIKLEKSFRAVLAGIAVSIFTPKRVGDFGGRVFALQTKNRIHGVFATLLGSYAQLLATILIGTIFFPLYWNVNPSLNSIIPDKGVIFLLIIGLIILSLIVYFNIHRVVIYATNLKFLQKHKVFIQFLQNYSKTDLAKVLVLAFLRYAVFSFQMFLLLRMFGVDINYGTAMVGISQVYLYMTIIPTVALGELGVRGSLGVWVLGVYSVASSGIIAASVLLWILNLAIPAILGVYFLWRFKF